MSESSCLDCAIGGGIKKFEGKMLKLESCEFC